MAIHSPQDEYLSKELERLLARLTIQVRYDHLIDARSGLCTFKGITYLFIDADVTLEDKLDLFKIIVSGYDLSAIYLPPVVREFLSGE